MYRREQVGDFLLIVLGITIVYGQRFVLPLGEFFVPIIVFIMFIIIPIWYYLGYVFINPIRFILYVLALLGLILSAGIAFIYFRGTSIFSFLYLVILYIPILFVARDNKRLGLLMKTFQTSMLIAAIIGIIQFLSQFIGITHVDLLSSLLGPYITQLYNFSIRLGFGSGLYKANAIFFLEPSFFSQWLSIAILIEIYFYRRFKNLIVFIPALLFTFSGTGLLVLAVGLIPIIFNFNFWYLFRLSVVFLLFVGLFFLSGYAEVTYSRLEQFDDPNASAYIRFIAPYKLYSEYLRNNPEKIWFGAGPGTVDTDLEGGGEGKNPRALSPLYIKMLYEYGIAGFGFFVFIFSSFFWRTNSILFSVVLWITYSIMGTGLLNPITLYLCYALGMLFINLDKKPLGHEIA